MSDSNVEPITPPIDDEAFDLAVSIAKRLKAELSWPSKDVWANSFDIVQDAGMIHKTLNSAFWSSQRGKMYFLNDVGDLVCFGKADMRHYLPRTFGEPMDYQKLDASLDAWAADIPEKKREKARAAKRQHCIALPWAYIIDFLLYRNQRDTLEMSVDMFAEEGRMEMLDESVRVIYTHKPFPTGPCDQAIVDDFREHFTQFDAFLEWVVASRFAQDRKKAFLWFKCDSDWGKGFLMSALAELGLVVPISVKEVERLFEGGPVGKSMGDFKRAFVLFVDEFKTVRSELKQLQNTIHLNPKNQLMQSVEVYAKVFASAEDVPSLAADGSIEDQFARRFNYLAGKGSLDARALRKSVGSRAYYVSIRNYAATRLNALVEQYISLGPDAAAYNAESVLEAFYDQHRITKSFTPMSDKLEELGEEFMGWLISRRTEILPGARLSDVDRLISDSLVSYNGDWYLRNASTLVGKWISAVKDESTAGTIKFKRRQIYESVAVEKDGRVIKSYRLGDDSAITNPITCVKLALEDHEKEALALCN
ncbi:hypothetical protein [Candidatus Marimicrobium litorale]|uniref:Uncharacterized protein n=1 Tax=Candidatus Marimicrobium litorale TaxID=2518991 RepID=A0ABT3T274_9GAMM|nr:hypothetical protein [Candidatus Marimicrobium litorale]MCX2976363.1 hypothetical protein [Candidatus Marimicrobium litorale]